MKVDERSLEKIAKVLANRRRILILKYIKSKKSASVGEIAGFLKLSFKATSKHLVIMDNADVLEKVQINLTMEYSLPKISHSLVEKLLELI